MIKSFENVIKGDRPRRKINRTVRDLIPIDEIYENGILKVGDKYSKTWAFSDINYAVASKAEKERMFILYCDILNSLDTSSTAKITILNRRREKEDIEKCMHMDDLGDGLDRLRHEYNTMMAPDGNIDEKIQEKYITVTTGKRNAAEAYAFFVRTGAEMSIKFSSLGSGLTEIGTDAKLKLLKDFYRPEEKNMPVDYTEIASRGHSAADYIAPDIIEKSADHLKVGNRYVRTFYLKDYASYIRDSFLTELSDTCPEMIISIDVIPTPTDEAVREIEKRLLGVETNITNWQRKQNQNNNFSAVIPYDMEMQRKESKEFLDDLISRDQRMMFALLTILISAPTMEELELRTESLLATARKYMCQVCTLKYQQIDGMNTALPTGVRRIDAFRTLTTESLGVFVPFKVQEIIEKGGIYLGKNAVSGSAILCNRENLSNQSAIILGIPGSGKSLCAKNIIWQTILSTADDICICDPEGEYATMLSCLPENMCSIVNMSAEGSDYLNAMYMTEGYGDGNPTVIKSQFIMSLIEQIDKKDVGPKHKSIIDRCTSKVYETCASIGQVPTLKHLRDALMQQSEPIARDIALSMELYTEGSLDIFSRESNVNLDRRILVFDIHALGAQLKSAGLLVITDTILNRVSTNFRHGKKTHVFIDEFHIVYENEYSAQFFTSAWRQFRKRNASPTAITQNVEYLLSSPNASSMLSNSECIIMLNQAASDRERLSGLLGISPEQMSFVTNANPGSGLIRYGGFLLPFRNDFPKDTKLYSLMTTKPGEGEFSVCR